MGALRLRECLTMQIRFSDNNHIRFSDAVAMLGDAKQAHSAFRRAINHTGDKVRTKTFRALAKQVGIPVGRMKKSNTVSAERANRDRLTYTLKSTGQHLSVKEFRPTQFKSGVKASPWGDRKTFGSTFMFAGNKSSGKLVGGGHVFNRTSTASFPIKQL